VTPERASASRALHKRDQRVRGPSAPSALHTQDLVPWPRLGDVLPLATTASQLGVCVGRVVKDREESLR
jgi:hypothetical protein